MCLEMYPNGFQSGVNTHLSLFVHIMRGEFDDVLQWPFTGRITIDIYSQTIEQWTQVKMVDFKEGPVERRCDCFTYGGYGESQILPQDQVAAKYICTDEKYNFVRFRVNRVELPY